MAAGLFADVETRSCIKQPHTFAAIRHLQPTNEDVSDLGHVIPIYREFRSWSRNENWLRHVHQFGGACHKNQRDFQ